MSNRKFLSGVALSTLMAAAVFSPAQAQVTTSSIRGEVVDVTGAPIAGANIVVSDPSTGYRRSVTAGPSGEFVVRNLSVGGTYSVVANSAGYQGEQIDGISVSLGETATLAFDLEETEQVQDVIVVTASSLSVADLAVGPNASFGLETLTSVPAINRNITDVLRIDPRIYIDESGQNSVQCGGKNSRFNSLTVDGVRLNDNFGLNSNGYPTERIPFSYDAIQEVAVELAPFDVEYGGFSACNINAVTKSGTNELHGGLFVDYTSNDLRSDSLEGDSITTGDYDEYRYGINVGGPIIEDKLFFFAAYEKLEGSNLFDRGTIGSGAVNEVALTQSDLDRILAIARDVYQYDPGTVPQSVANEDEKLLVKLDWNISEQHRAALTYTYNDGFNTTESDGDLDEFELSNHLYERGAELNSYVGSLYSDWTDTFSTEFRIGYSELDARVASLGGTDFGEMRIETPDVDVYIGGDDSRQSNKLKYDTFNLALKGFYAAGDHSLTFGFERESLDVFNLFIQHTETEIRFDGIDNFENGFADAIYYNNSPTLDPAQAAAEFSYAVNTFYFQDEYDLQNGIVLTAGLRYDRYETDDKPVVNPDFLADYGFGNDANLDGVDLLQPRIAFTWDVDDSLDLRGGIGMYSGGNPNVWYSNNFSNNNVLQFGQRGRDFGLTDGSLSLLDPSVAYSQCEDGVPSGPGYCIPTVLVEAVQGGTGSNFEINYLDPDFELPYEWKVSLGATKYLDLPEFGGEYTLTADLLYTVTKDSAVWLRGDLVQDGTTTFRGVTYPSFDSVREASFVLTNADADAKSLLMSFGLSKDYDNGFDWSLGYAYSDAEDVHPMTSSVAFSNYVNRAFVDPQTPVAATSDYNTKHRFTGVANYERAFFGDNLTKFAAFGQVSSGRPYSITYGGADCTIGVFGFTPFLDFADQCLAGSDRNSEEGSWWGKVDVKVTQEFDGFGDHQAEAFIVIDNFTNLLNDEWGILREPDFPPTVPLGSRAESRVGDASRYEIRIGLNYQF
ncbi:MAG: TonB-dependent receptor [Henriciella sp.]